MFKNIFKGTLLYIVISVFVVPIIILLMVGNASRKNNGNDNQTQTTGILTLTTTPASAFPQDVSLPSKEDIVKTFCNFVDEGQVSEAVGMMDIANDSDKQLWGVYLNSFSSFNLVNIKKSAIDESGYSFEVDVDAKLKNGNEGYGWVNGVNKKWINLVDVGAGHYKIQGIATGP